MPRKSLEREETQEAPKEEVKEIEEVNESQEATKEVKVETPKNAKHETPKKAKNETPKKESAEDDEPINSGEKHYRDYQQKAYNNKEGKCAHCDNGQERDLKRRNSAERFEHQYQHRDHYERIEQVPYGGLYQYREPQIYERPAAAGYDYRRPFNPYRGLQEDRFVPRYPQDLYKYDPLRQDYQRNYTKTDFERGSGEIFDGNFYAGKFDHERKGNEHRAPPKEHKVEEHKHHHNEEKEYKLRLDRNHERPELKDQYRGHRVYQEVDRYERKEKLHHQKYYSPHRLHAHGGGEHPPKHRYDYHNAPNHGKYEPYYRHGPRRDFERAKSYESKEALDFDHYDPLRIPNRKYFKFEDRKVNRGQGGNLRNKHGNNDPIPRAYDRKIPDRAREIKDRRIDDILKQDINRNRKY